MSLREEYEFNLQRPEICPICGNKKEYCICNWKDVQEYLCIGDVT